MNNDHMKELYDALTAHEIARIEDAIDAGGATWDENLEPITHKTGYMVALPKYSIKRNKYDIVGIVETVNRLAETIARDLLPGVNFVGLWVDGDTVYLDISLRETRRDIAVAMGKSFDQKAIYDLEHEKSIWV